MREHPVKHSHRDHLYSFVVALGLHGLALLGMGFAFTQPADFGMAAGKSSIEVDLIAAPPLETPQPPKSPAESTEPFPIPPEIPIENTPIPLTERFVARQELNPSRSQNYESKPILQPEINRTPDDNPSQKTGTDRTTFHSDHGTESESKPEYLRNPPPIYPEQARANGQQGTVLLRIEVDPEGRPTSINLKQSAGYPLLDQAALKAVRQWRFYPARVGPVAISSLVDVPIRFQLNQR